MTTSTHQQPQTGRSRGFAAAPRNSQRNAGRQPQKTGPAEWQRNYDRYCELARSPGSGDAVAREQYWQQAEHYCRLLNGSATL